MNPFLEKEYHPVIEAFISQYVEDEMDTVELNAFEELLVHDDDLRELASNAKKGKQLLGSLKESCSSDGFLKRLNDSFST